MGQESFVVPFHAHEVTQQQETARREEAAMDPRLLPYSPSFLLDQRNAGRAASITPPGIGTPLVPSLSSGHKFFTVETLQASAASPPFDAGKTIAGGSVLSQGFDIYGRRLQTVPPPSNDVSYTQPHLGFPAAGAPSLTFNQVATNRASHAGFGDLSAWNRGGEAELAAAYRLTRELQGERHSALLTSGPSPLQRSDFVRPFQKFEERFRTEIPRSSASAAIAGQRRTKSYCSLCKVYCSSILALNEHFAGKRHKREEEKLNEMKSQKDDASKVKKLDNLEKGSTVLTTAGETSLVAAVAKAIEDNKRKRDSEGLQGPKKRQQDRSVDVVNASVTENADKEIRKKVSIEKCEVCEVFCSGRIALKDHLRGKKHAARIKMLQELEAETNKRESGPISNGDLLVT